MNADFLLANKESDFIGKSRTQSRYMTETKYRSGYTALIGRPNAGKSTLLNFLVGEKIAAVSNKPQTTRNKIQGIVTRDEGQIVFVDTPGVHKPGYLLNRRMMSAVYDALYNVDVVVLLRDASVSTGNGDNFVLDIVKKSGKPSLLVLNKIDKIKEKGELLPLIEWYSKEHDWQSILPISALRGIDIEPLLLEIIKNLPEGEPVFSADEMTDQPIRQIAAEFVREKILRVTGDEIPYVTAVVTEMFDESDPTLTKIYCAIYVEKSSQKAIVIGKKGAKLKQVGTEARQDIEKLLGHKCYLELFVKVREDWRNSQQDLNDIGITE